ncbi:MAG: glycosyltransferase family 4 protein [Candidatus Daviesbacteria bacterium]|nr:glycosyltransferase family 4 protein [Candidatus Daviesbacteria bacterium]
MKVLQLTVHLSPNVGGVETHLNDLFNALIKRDWKVFVLAYQPLSTKTNWKTFEKEKNLTILRIPWLRGFFEKLVHFPIIEFIYLIPGLFLITPFVIISYRPSVIHAHGISAAISAIFWGKLFNIRTVISLHSIYAFPKKGLYHDFVKLLFENCDFILSLSNKSNEEVQLLGIKKQKTNVFTYWVDLQKFKKIPSAKKRLGWEGKFIVLFVGRLIQEKGIKILIEAASLWDKKINLVIAGSGLLEKYILEQSKKIKNISFVGKVSQDNLRMYYSGADCLIVPSTSEEGFGRVIIESLACETPVVASKRGAIPEAMDETVGRFIDVTPENIKQEIYFLYKNPSFLKKLATNSRQFAERRYSESNVATITKAYTG